MINQIKLWLKFAQTKVSERMAYRGEFFISILSMFTLELVGPLLVFVIYYNTSGFDGWNFYQVMLLQGLFLIVKGLSFVTFFGITWNSVMKLKEGVFDLILIRPRNELFMFICDSIDSEDIGKFFAGLSITIYALIHLPQITFLNFIFGICAMLLGFGLLFSFALFSASFAFLFVGTFRIYEIHDNLFMIGSYPKSVYPKSVGTFFTAIIPIFVISVFPAKIMFGEFSNDIFISAIAVCILIALGYLSWKFSLKKYTSAGG